VPHSGDISLGISILSYAGTVTVGVEADESLVADPEQIIAHFQAEFDLLCEFAQSVDAAPEDRKAEADTRTTRSPEGESSG
jgi:hypothetical protein